MKWVTLGRLSTAVLVALGAASVVGLPSAQAATLSRCPGKAPTISNFHTSADWYENLDFDGHGTMWVTNLFGNRVEAYSPAGKQVASIPADIPGAVRRGPDGLMYANSGDNTLAPKAEVLRFNPADPRRTVRRWATGLGSANGGTFDQAGNYYVASRNGIIRLRPTGQVDKKWTAAAGKSGATGANGVNGLVVVQNTLYATLTLDLRSPVLRIPLDHPDKSERLVELSAGAVPKFFDDVNVGPDGKLYVVGFISGELIRVDRTSRQACLLAAGLHSPTSARFASSFGPYDRDIFVTQATGSILRIRTPR